MIKKLIISALISFGFSLNIFSQGYTITFAPTERYTWEGSTITYSVAITGTIPSSIIFGAEAVNGTVIDYSISSSPRSYITVQWNCKVTSGTIKIVDASIRPQSVLYTYNVVIWSYSNAPNFCSQAYPVTQSLPASGQLPSELSVINCTPYCVSSYNFQYQWQVGDVPYGAYPQVPSSYENIPRANGINYQPPASTIAGIKAYRRVTTFTEIGTIYTLNSQASIIEFIGPLNGGIISGSGFIYVNGIPAIDQTPASGGFCNYNYQYTWERSESNGPWYTIAPGQWYPNLPVTVNSSFRRRVDCNNEIAYSNILSYTVSAPLNPGYLEWDVGPFVIPYNAIPNLPNFPATGGLCLASNYVYTWERSVENGPWQAIGTGQNYPSTVGLIGNSRFRRKVSCGGEELYTNILSFTMSPYTSPNTENKNYVRINNILIPGVINWPQADNLSTGDKIQTTTYYDGLGRAIQNVSKEVSELQPNVWGDIASFTEYDAAGRTDKSYLTFPTTSTIGKFKENAKTEQVAYIHNTHGESATAPTYAQATFENSPFSRVISVQESGEGWIGKTNSMQYEFNTATEHIKIWTIDFTETGMPVVSGEYADGKLTKNVSIDEKGKKVYEYTDFSGNTILKKVQLDNTVLDNTHTGWLCTYYVYDDLGQLRTTITPKAVTWLNQYGWAFTNSDVYKELCFYNYFDERGRTVIKHSAGAGEIHFVYDNRDRLVLSQDENQRTRAAKQWTFYLYDKENRAIASGLLENTGSRAINQVYATTGMNNQDIQLTIYTGQNETITAYNPVAGSTSLGLNYTNLVINAVTYYDNYNYPLVKQFTRNYSFAPTTSPYVEPTVVTSRVLGMSTGSKVRVLDANYDNPGTATQKFLTSTAYFDEKGRSLEGLTDNIKGNTDYVVMQYDFSGKTLSVCEKQNFPATTLGKFVTITQFEYNKIGQTISVSEKFYDQPYKKLASYTYDALGRVSEKKLSPDFNNGLGIETLKYDYNLHGSLIGINKDYALSNSSLAQWDHYFGMYLGYDNKDSKFAAPRYDGLLTGVLWKAQGDNNPRKYDYDYDNAGRLTAANFTQKEKPTDASWANTFADFSMTNVAYDENGNLLSMNHKSIIPGNAVPVFTDKLAYTYNVATTGAWTNKLERVADNTTDLTASNNGLLGDFKDEIYGSNTLDYKYDANGNMVVDNNKKIRIGSGNGIEYNFMDKPQKVTIEGKSITEFIYDATGDKLGKKVTNTVSNQITTTWYNGSYVYEETGNPAAVTLQFISNEEGRVRMYTPISQPRVILGNSFDLLDGSGNVLKGVFEFFVKDNLQNTRAILSEETHLEHHNCTMEFAEQTYEYLMFQDDAGRQVENTRTAKNSPPINTSWTVSGTGAGLGAQVSKLNALNTVGPNMLLKVMAGDKLTLKTDYFYNQAASGPGNNITSIVTAIIKNLLGSVTSPGTSAVKGAATAIQTNLSNTNGELYQFIQNQNASTSTSPKAHLNYVFFDENFKFVPYDPVTGLGSFGSPVSTAGDGQAIILANVRVPKNGYVFVYLSNSSNIDVYFDNLDIIHDRGRLVEENAYYTYGLKIKGISGKAIGKLDNKYGYQGVYAEEDTETGWDEFDLRMYNPQIGRWNGVDPKEQFASPYIGMGNNPASNIDKDGGLSIGEWSAIAGAIGGAVGAHYIIKNNPDLGNGYKKAISIGLPLLGAGIGYAVGESAANNPNILDREGTPMRYRDDDGVIQNKGFNGSSNLWSNFKQFYVGLVGATSNGSEVGRTEDAAGLKYATTPDINLLGWRDNNLPDWDFWKTRGTKEPHVSKIGFEWRSAAASPIYSIPGYILAGVVWGADKFYYPVFKIPVIAWYLYRLIHKGKKGQSPYAYGIWRGGL
jgi:RHS repeat-associated protein